MKNIINTVAEMVILNYKKFNWPENLNYCLLLKNPKIIKYQDLEISKIT